MRSPAYIASLVAALLALVPAVIRLYESILNQLAAASLYLAWLVLWILTGASLLWTGFGRKGARVTRIAIGVCGGGMLLGLIMTVNAVSDPPTSTAANLAATAHFVTSIGAATCLWAERGKGRLVQVSWSLAAVGALILSIAAIFVPGDGNPLFVQLGLPGGTFLLGAGLSLAMGRFGESVVATGASDAASQEP